MTAPRVSPDTARHNLPYVSQHIARYQLAGRALSEGPVLDIACGTGYGLPLLGSHLRAVGVDSSPEALAEAHFRGPVVRADGGHLPFPDEAFGSLVSFETIEHLHEREGFLDELHRVLRPGGTLLLSTPNANYTKPVDGRPRNPHHVHEYTPAELEASLKARFADVALSGQVLRSGFKMSPFSDDHSRVPRTVRSQTRLLLWRLLVRVPRRMGDVGSRMLWGHPLSPSPSDFRFEKEAVPTAPVLVAQARRR